MRFDGLIDLLGRAGGEDRYRVGDALHLGLARDESARLLLSFSNPG
jgi:hypothetical protein